MPLFILKFLGIFVNPKTALIAWGAVLVIAILGYGAWSWKKIDDLKRDNIETVLNIQNKQLQDNNAALQADQASMLDRMSQIAGAVETLNGKYSKSSQQRQRDLDGLTGPRTPPGERPDTQALQDRANSMNDLFKELETISGTNPE